jgi:hypothetical protein
MTLVLMPISSTVLTAFARRGMPANSQSESFVSFRTPAPFSRCSSLRIFPNALSAKIKPINPNMKPVLPTLHLNLSMKYE